jgi:hypothetical protein
MGIPIEAGPMDVRPCHEKVNQSRDVTAVLQFRRRPAVGKDLPAPQKDRTGGWLGRDRPGPNRLGHTWLGDDPSRRRRYAP